MTIREMPAPETVQLSQLRQAAPLRVEIGGIDRGRLQVTERKNVRRAVDPPPVRRGLGQRALQQILGRMLITGQHVGQAKQLRGPGRDELPEVPPGPLVHWPSPVLTP